MPKYELIRSIYNEIDNIPPIPNYINRIRKLIIDPKSEISAISDEVKKDAGLTANVLRVANSAWYMTKNAVDTVERAIALIGLRRLSSILLTIGAKKVMTERFNHMESIWKHSYNCAFFSQNIIKMKSKIEEEAEIAYIAGLLHDIGKLVLLSLSPDLIKRITNLSITKHISVSKIEKQAIGLNHAEIGQKIASKWKFPPILINSIGYHHNPHLPPDQEECQLMVNSVYLANILCKTTEYTPQMINEIDPQVLKYFKLDTEESFKLMYDKLMYSYQIAPEIKFI